jgi:hypothetical protein
MTDRIRYALRIAAVVQQLTMPSFAVTAPAGGADAAPMPAVAVGASLDRALGAGEHRQAHFVWPTNIAALRYRGLARVLG